MLNRRTGSTSWRVSGMMHGTRIRRNYPDKAYALAEKSALEITALQETSGLRSVGAFLSESQLREAEALFLRVKERTKLNEQFGLGHDILRHTFISMHVGKFRSMGDAALQRCACGRMKSSKTS